MPIKVAAIVAEKLTIMLFLAAETTARFPISDSYQRRLNPLQTPMIGDSLNEKTTKTRTGRYKNAKISRMYILKGQPVLPVILLASHQGSAAELDVYKHS